ncbi:hypothetical protein GCM10027051_34540 [Niabella terrae]
MKKIIPALVVLMITLTACPDKKDVIDNRQDRKVGYLFYTEFIDNYNSSLEAAFARFKKAGVTDLIIDLRYNHGGSLNAASYLASLIAPQSAVSGESVFTQLDFNNFMNDLYGTRNRQVRLKPDALASNLDLETVYIIATDDSYSAAELLTYCLRPYMNVVHIGSETGGKFTASVTVTAYDDYNDAAWPTYDPEDLSASAKDSLKDWAMQPIVAIYKDSRGNDFSEAATLVPDIKITSQENDPSYYLPLGDTEDYLLATALDEIKGTPLVAKQRAVTPAGGRKIGVAPARIFSKKDQLLTRSVLMAPVFAADAGTTAAGINTVSQFVYDGLSVYYKWSDYVVDKAPNSADNDPEAYFYDILYPLDTDHGWSWITDDVSSLFADFSGEPKAFGWGLAYFWTNSDRTQLVAVVKYVYPNTPAAQAGIKRGDVLEQINGTIITATPGDAGFYGKLSGLDPISVGVSRGASGQTINIAPVTINTNPVLKDTIYTLGNSGN